jgi:hypothetical protein
MNILKRKYAKVIDKITVEFAPKSLGGVVGFDNNESLCNANGYYFLKFSPQTGNTAVYELIGNEVIQSWVDIDTELYAQNVVAKIRERYSENEELAILRKAYAGIDRVKFDEYNAYCEACKKEIKLEMIG